MAPKTPKSTPKSAQPQPYRSQNPKCGTEEHQAQIDTFLLGLNPDQLLVVRSLLTQMSTGPAIMGGYRKSVHYMKEWFGAHPNPVQLA